MRARTFLWLAVPMLTIPFVPAGYARGQEPPGAPRWVGELRGYFAALAKEPIPKVLQVCFGGSDSWGGISLGAAQRREEALPVLRTWLRSGTPRQKMLAVRVLSEMRDDKVIPDLLSLLRKGNAREAADALVALCEMKAAASLPRFKEILADGSTPLDQKLLACSALGAAGAPGDIPALLPALEGDDPQLRLYAAAAIARLGGTEGRGLVLEGLGRGDPMAIEGAEFMDDAESAGMLETLAASGSGWFSEARAALERRRLRGIGSTPERVSALRRLALSGEDAGLGRWAVESLGDLDTPEACSALGELSAAAFEARDCAPDYYESLITLKLRGNGCVSIVPPPGSAD